MTAKSDTLIYTKCTQKVSLWVVYIEDMSRDALSQWTATLFNKKLGSFNYNWDTSQHALTDHYCIVTI